MSKQNDMVLVEEAFPAMADFINWLFNRLHAKYGSDWTRQWDGMPIGDAKSDWSCELAWTFGKPDVIRYALQNLPERCPNSIQFRNLCRGAPRSAEPVEKQVKADPQRVKDELAKLSPAPAKTDGREWARRILARHAQGDRIGLFALNQARGALGEAA